MTDSYTAVWDVKSVDYNENLDTVSIKYQQKDRVFTVCGFHNDVYNELMNFAKSIKPGDRISIEYRVDRTE